MLSDVLSVLLKQPGVQSAYTSKKQSTVADRVTGLTLLIADGVQDEEETAATDAEQRPYGPSELC